MSLITSLVSIRAPVASDFDRVETDINAHFQSNVALIQSLNQHVFESGGKRLRALLVLLASRALGYTGSDHYKIACVIEFIHTATLLHDDVVDESLLRRGKPTANKIWGNSASVLVGDYLYSQAFVLLAEVANLPIMQSLAKASHEIAEGEVLQLMHCKNPQTTEAQYLQIITQKTARLFSAACDAGAILCNSNEATRAAMHAYGTHLGIAFQLIDDKLDYDGDIDRIGKNIGDDLSEGKPTLPLIYALQQGNAAARDVIAQCIREGLPTTLSESEQAERIQRIIDICKETGALDYTAQAANREVHAAIESLTCLPSSPYRDALEALARFALERDC